VLGATCSEEARECKKCLGMAGTGVGSVRDIRLERRRSAASSSSSRWPSVSVRRRTRGVGTGREAGDEPLSHDAKVSVLDRCRSTRASDRRLAILVRDQGGQARKDNGRPYRLRASRGSSTR
jgi:hypothetical protein